MPYISIPVLSVSASPSGDDLSGRDLSGLASCMVEVSGELS